MSVRSHASPAGRVLVSLGRWAVVVTLGVIMSTLGACSEEKRFAFHGLSYNQAVDMPQVDILDCIYGDGLGAHTQHEVDAGKAQRGECGNMFGDMPVGDFLYVKWRDKSSGKEYEDRVDLRKRLPPIEHLHGSTVRFLIQQNQLFVYLVPSGDWEGKKNYLPIGQQPNGPGDVAHLNVKTLYPDNSPAQVRGGRMPAEYYEQEIRKMHEAMRAEQARQP